MHVHNYCYHYLLKVIPVKPYFPLNVVETSYRPANFSRSQIDINNGEIGRSGIKMRRRYKKVKVMPG